MTDADIRKIADECAATAGVEVTDFRKQGRTNPSAPFVVQFWREGLPPLNMLLAPRADEQTLRDNIGIRLANTFAASPQEAAVAAVAPQS